MENGDVLFVKLKGYLSDKYGIDAKDIDGNTFLLNDLELKGDDIDDFFSSLIKDFDVKVKKLNLSKYFVGDEPFDFLSPIVRLFKREKVDQMPTIKVNDVVRFIETGILQ